MKFTNPNGDIFEGTVEEIFTLVSRMRPALPDLTKSSDIIQKSTQYERHKKNANGKFPCPNCGREFSRSALSYHLHTAVVKCTPKGNGSGEKERILQKVALADKLNGGL